MQVLNPTRPVAHYSHGIETNGLIFVAGQTAMDEEWGVLHEGDMAAQTRQAIENISAVLAQAGAKLSDVVSTTVYVSSYEKYDEYNRVYAEMFGDTRPARATVRADLVRPELLVEIQAIAVRSS